MKQAHSGPSSRLMAGRFRSRWWPFATDPPRPVGHYQRQNSIKPDDSWGWTILSATVAGLSRAVAVVLTAVWRVVSLPFRLVFLLIALLGRAAALAIGFALMVAGMFFLAGPFFILGIPTFIVGLILTLRSLD